MKEIVPIAMPGTHERFLSFFQREGVPKETKILDVGAGHGAFTKRLYDMGYDVAACDLFPEEFYYKEVECKKVDITQEFPYEDNSFEMAIAIEVSEHINDHENFFGEMSRILKPGGTLYLSTPNILSLKSRFRFLFSGFFYSFKPLELTNYNGLQHVAARTIDQYNYIAIKQGFQQADYDIDREQSTSRWLRFFMAPFLWFATTRKKIPKGHNEKKLLLGRLLFLKFQNK